MGWYCALSILTLLVYDWSISISDEIELVWKSRDGRKGPAIVYFFGRYPQLLEILFAMSAMNPMSPTSCRALSWLQIIMQIVGFLAWAAFSTLRTYALSDKSRLLASATLGLSFVPAVLNLVQYVRWTHVQSFSSATTCTVVNTASQSVLLKYTLLSCGALILADLLVIAVTWYSTYKLCKWKQLGKVSLGWVLLCDGSISFIALASVNAISILLTAIEVDDPFSVTSDLTHFTTAITSVLLSHFILDLRRTNRSSPDESRPGNDTLTNLHFRRSIGDNAVTDITSFGGPVDASLRLNSMSWPDDSF